MPDLVVQRRSGGPPAPPPGLTVVARFLALQLPSQAQALAQAKGLHRSLGSRGW